RIPSCQGPFKRAKTLPGSATHLRFPAWGRVCSGQSGPLPRRSGTLALGRVDGEHRAVPEYQVADRTIDLLPPEVGLGFALVPPDPIVEVAGRRPTDDETVALREGAAVFGVRDPLDGQVVAVLEHLQLAVAVVARDIAEDGARRDPVV